MLYANPEFRTHECTIAQTIQCTGTGRYSGREVSMTLLPAPANSGIHFVRRDVFVNRSIIAASWSNVTETHPCLVLKNEYGTTVTMVELLLAALRGCGIDNVLIELSHGEVPIFDGSSGPLTAMIQVAGIVPQDAPRYGIWIDEFIEVRHGDSYACLREGSMPTITVDIARPALSQGAQQYSYSLLDSVFEHDIANSQQVDIDASIDTNNKNVAAIAFNDDPQRRVDEYARYKILECIGGMALFEYPIFGHLYLYQPSNFITNALLEAMDNRPTGWRKLSYTKIDDLTGGVAGAAYEKVAANQN